MEIGGFKMGVMEMQILGVDDGVKRPTPAAVDARLALIVRMARYGIKVDLLPGMQNEPVRASGERARASLPSQGAPLAAVTGTTGQRTLGERTDDLGLQIEVTSLRLSKMEKQIADEAKAKEDAEDDAAVGEMLARIGQGGGRGKPGGGARVIPLSQKSEDPGADESDEAWLARMVTLGQGQGNADADAGRDLSLSQAAPASVGQADDAGDSDDPWVTDMLSKAGSN
jgi:hypothetical protein